MKYLTKIQNKKHTACISTIVFLYWPKIHRRNTPLFMWECIHTLSHFYITFIVTISCCTTSQMCFIRLICDLEALPYKLKYTELIVILIEFVWDNLCFVTYGIIITYIIILVHYHAWLVLSRHKLLHFLPWDYNNRIRKQHAVCLNLYNYPKITNISTTMDRYQEKKRDFIQSKSLKTLVCICLYTNAACNICRCSYITHNHNLTII